MTHTYVVDSGNVSRVAKRIFIVDSSNTTRQVKRLFVIDDTNTARLVYVAAQVIPQSLTATSEYPAAATCTVYFTTAGTEEIQTNQIPSGEVVGNWLPGGSTSDYQIMCTLQSGTAPNAPGATNTLNTWLPVTTDYSWGLQATLHGSSLSNSLLFEISTDSSTVIASGVITMESTVGL
jgi:hypothetical protein